MDSLLNTNHKERYSLLIGFLILIQLSLYTQNNNSDIIYLKNKKVYQGTILKNQMGIVSIKTIVEGEEIVLDFQQFEIDKISYATRPNIEGSNNQTAEIDNAQQTLSDPQLSKINPNSANPIESLNNSNKLNFNLDNKNTIQESTMSTYKPSLTQGKTSGFLNEDPFTPLPLPKKPYREWTRDIRGFRGFIEYRVDLGVGEDRSNYMDFIKSVGFQFNPIFYLGTGVAYKLSTNKESALPVFINPRLNLTDREDINPFWDVKIGYSVLESKGAFISTGFGTSFVFGRGGKLAANIALTYSYLNANYKVWDDVSKMRVKTKAHHHNIGLSIAFEY